MKKNINIPLSTPYLKGNEKNVYNGPLKQPSKSFNYYKDLLINKLKLIYLKKFN